MLTVTVRGEEFFNEDTSEFVTVGDFDLQLEHSLVSLSKWESIYEKPFLNDKSKTADEIVGYVQCMILNKEVPDDLFGRMTQDNFDAISEYINSKQSATWFADSNRNSRTRETITSELIYYWMTAFHIPFEAETWHLNRLFTLIRVCSIKQEDPKKRKPDLASRRALNAQRRQALGTTG